MRKATPLLRWIPLANMVVLAAGLSWLLTMCITGLTQKQANAIIGPLYLFFVLIPLLISLEVRMDETEGKR